MIGVGSQDASQTLIRACILIGILLQSALSERI